MVDVVVIGDALIDEFHFDGAVNNAVGGSALNVAVGIRTLGSSSALIGMVADDPDGALIADYLHQQGVSLYRSPAPLGTARATSTRVNGEPSYDFNEASRRRRITFDTESTKLIDAAALVAVSGIALDDDAQLAELVASIRNPSHRLVVDPNPRAGMLHDRNVFARNLLTLAATSLLVKVSDEDAVLLGFGRLQNLTARLLSSGARYVLATHGPGGAELADRDNAVRVHVPIAALSSPIVDTMGAGDATLATTLAGLANGIPSDAQSWTALLERSMVIAAATCRVPGAALQNPFAGVA